jgi:hypothetical protein
MPEVGSKPSDRSCRAFVVSPARKSFHVETSYADELSLEQDHADGKGQPYSSERPKCQEDVVPLEDEHPLPCRRKLGDGEVEDDCDERWPQGLADRSRHMP